MVGGEHKDDSVLKTKYLNRKQLLRKYRKHSPKRVLEDNEENREILPQVCNYNYCININLILAINNIFKK